MSVNDELLFAAYMMIMIVLLGASFHDWKGRRKFDLKVYSSGPLIINFKIPWSKCFNPSERIIKTESGDYKIIGERILLFKYFEPIFGFDFRTPFPLKGSILVECDIAMVSARAPFHSCFILLIWCLITNFLGIKKILEIGFHGSAILVVGWGAASLFVLVSYFIEKRRLLKVLDEILTEGKVHHSTSSQLGDK